MAFATFPNAVLFYDYDGKFQQKVELEDIVHGMSLKGDLIYFLLADRRDGVVNDTSLEVLNYVTGEKKKILEQGVRPVKSLWTRGSTLSSGKDACYYVERYTNKVYKLAGDSCELLFRLNLGKHNLPENMLVEDIDMEKFRDQCSENRYVFSLVNFSELNNGFIMTSDRSGFFHYDKKKDALNHYDFIENTEHGVDFSYMPTLESEKDKIAFVVGEYQIAAAKTHMTDSRDEKIKTFLNNIPEDTNPILFLYDLKKTTH